MKYMKKLSTNTKIQLIGVKEAKKREGIKVKYKISKVQRNLSKVDRIYQV